MKKGLLSLALAYLGWVIVLVVILPNENHGEKIEQYRGFATFSIPEGDTTGTAEWIEPEKQREVGIDGGVYFKSK